MTPQEIEAAIRAEVYVTGDQCVSASTMLLSEYCEGERVLAPLDRLTVCILLMRDGRSFAGQSISEGLMPPDKNAERSNARHDAIKRIRSTLTNQGKPCENK